MRKIAFVASLLAIGILAAGFWYFRPAVQYGAPFKGAPMASLTALLTESERYLASDVHVRAKIVRQCPTAGCWFFLEDGSGKQLRVELGHLGLTFPQRIGRFAEVEGRLLKSGNDLELVGNGVRFE